MAQKQSKLWLALTIFAVGLYGTTSLKITRDASEAMLPADRTQLAAYNTYLEDFPSDQTFIVVLVDLLCSPEGWSLLERIADEVDSRPFVEYQYSLTSDTAKYVQETEEGIDVRSFREVPFENAESRCLAASTYPPFKNVLIANAGTHAAVYVSTDESLDAVEATQKMRDLILPFQLEAASLNGRILLSGEATLSAELSEAVNRDSALIGLSIALMTLLVLVLTRSLRSSLLVIGLMTFVLGVVFGFMGFFEIAYSTSTSLVVFLLVPLSAAFVIHAYGYLARHQEEASDRVVSTRAFLYAGLTTAIGFACTGLTPAVDIKNLAMVGVVGVATILVGLWLFVIPNLSTKLKGFALGNTVPRYFFTQPIIPWSAFVVLLILTILGLSRLTVSYGPSDFLPDANPIKTDYVEVGNTFGRMNLPLLVETANIYDPGVWERVAELIQHAKQATEGTLTAIWFYDHMSALATAFYEGEFSFPQDEFAFEQLEIFFDRNDTKYFWNDDANNIAVHFQIPFSGSHDYLSFRDEILETAGQKELSAKFVGRVSSIFETGHRVGQDTLVGLLIAASLISIVLLVIFKNVKLAFIGVLVNVIPVMFGLSVLGLLGTPIDMGSAIVAAIAFGIVLDDSTHLLVYIDDLIKSGYDPDTATNKALRDLIAPIVSTTIAISVGFLVLFLAEVELFSDFALLISTTLACALIVDVWILPLLVRTGLRDRTI